MPHPNWLTAWLKVNSKPDASPEEHDAVTTGCSEQPKPSPTSTPAGSSSIPGSVADTTSTTPRSPPDVLSSSQRSRFRRMNHRRRQSKSSSRSSGDTLNKSGSSNTSELFDSSTNSHGGGGAAAATSFSNNKRSASQKRRATAMAVTAEGGPSITNGASGVDSTKLHPGERLLAGIFGRHQPPQTQLLPQTQPQQPHPTCSSLSRNEPDHPPAVAVASPSSASHTAAGSLPVTTTGKYLNEAAFLQQLEQRLQFDCRVAQEGIPRSVTVPPPVQPPPEVAPSPYYYYYHHHHPPTATATVPSPPLASRVVVSEPSPLAPPPPPATTTTTTTAPPPPPPLPLNLLVESLRSHAFFTGEPNRPCSNCIIQEEQLQSVLDDLEYMRSVAVRNEQKAVAPNNVSNHRSPDGEHGGTMKRNTFSSWSSSRTLADASKQLNEVSSRHKKQICVA